MINYSKHALPTLGETTEIAPGVLWLRMSLPFDLDHINLYLVEDESGWFVIDTGLNTTETKAAWERVFEQLSKPVIGVIVTHMHPDHVGLAGWITEKFRVPMYMTRMEYYVARALLAGPGSADRWSDRDYYARAGMDEDVIDKLLSQNNGFASVVSGMPLTHHRLQHGDRLSINKNQWEVIVGAGHSPEHACLYCHELGILISGDQVLPAISPNIGVYSQEPEANPLDEYLTSFTPLMALPEDTLTLPAHNQPFYGLHQRIKQLKQHHQRHLNALLVHCSEPQTVMACLPVLFKRKLSGRNIYFAVAECLSHLNYLLSEEMVTRQLSDNGQYLYQSIELPLDEDIEQPTMDFIQV